MIRLLLLLVLLAPAEVLTQASAEGWTETSARAFMTALMADNTIDPPEKAWLECLARAEGPVEVGGVTVPAPTGRARELFVLYAAPPNMHTLWNGTPQQVQQLVDLALINPATWERVTRFVRSRLEPAWKASSVLNEYSPFVNELGPAYNRLKACGEPTLEAGSRLLFEAVQRLPGPGEQPVPLFLYQWLLQPYQS